MFSTCQRCGEKHRLSAIMRQLSSGSSLCIKCRKQNPLQAHTLVNNACVSTSRPQNTLAQKYQNTQAPIVSDVIDYGVTGGVTGAVTYAAMNFATKNALNPRSALSTEDNKQTLNPEVILRSETKQLRHKHIHDSEFLNQVISAPDRKSVV